MTICESEYWVERGVFQSSMYEELIAEYELEGMLTANPNFVVVKYDGTMLLDRLKIWNIPDTKAKELLETVIIESYSTVDETMINNDHSDFIDNLKYTAACLPLCVELSFENGYIYMGMIDNDIILLKEERHE